jgi:outer membrane protein assembly factor BamE (lipoprotein component of BamABCDE complex)
MNVRLVQALAFLLFCAAVAGCSVVQATSGAERRDVSVLAPGTDRYAVLAELGQPVVTETDAEGHKVDVFRFRQGTHAGVKAGKAVGYGLLAVGTFGLSEVITSPVEGAVSKGAEVQLKVTYDGDEAVREVVVLKDDRWVRLDALETSAAPPSGG